MGHGYFTVFGYGIIVDYDESVKQLAESQGLSVFLEKQHEPTHMFICKFPAVMDACAWILYAFEGA